MAGHQFISITGNVGKEPETKFIASGKQVTTFSVAVSDGRETTWFRVTCWDKTAEIAAQYVQKGGQVQIVGRVKASAYLDKEGQAQATLEVTAQTLVLLGTRQQQADNAPSNDYPSTDIPF